MMEDVDKRVRLLLVEDSPDDAEIIRLELERHGFVLDWHRVDTERDFVAALESREWDFIVSDFQMPTFDGLRAFAVCVERAIDTPFVFVSGALGEERAVEAMRAGARDYLLKGNLTRLSAVVTRELRAAKTRRERRFAEAAAQTERRRLAMAVAASGVAVFEVQLPAGPDLYASPRLAEILGYPVLPTYDRILPWLRDQVHPEDLATVERSGWAFVSGQTERYRAELRMRSADDRWVEVAVWAQAVERDPAGAAVHVVAVLLDLSEPKRLEVQLRQSQKMEAVGLLAGGIAHDFNNLLTAIMSFGQFVLDALPPDGPVHADMLEVLRAAERAEGLTSQLLAFSRRRAVSPRVLDLNEVVRGVDRMLQRVLGEHIAVTTTLEADLAVRIDPGALEQVLMNLAVNARDAMPAGGSLRIGTSEVLLDPLSAEGLEVPPGPYVVLSMNDTGTGIDPEIQRRIFEPFFTTKETGRGTGLGLSTCYGIVTQAGGQIRVQSELGVGSTFAVWLPASLDPSVPSPRERGSPQSVHGTERILVVEDDEQVRRVTVRLLSALGYGVIEAGNGPEALVRLGEGVDLLVTDMVMPGMSGQELSRLATERWPSLRILAMSGYSDALVQGDGLGIELIHKPFTPELLARRVRQVLDATAYGAASSDV